jgi:hypothetical protein
MHEVVRWRIIDLCQWLREEYEVTVSKQTLSRELWAMGYRKLSARPRHHAQAACARARNLRSVTRCHGNAPALSCSAITARGALLASENFIPSPRYLQAAAP